MIFSVAFTFTNLQIFPWHVSIYNFFVGFTIDKFTNVVSIYNFSAGFVSIISQIFLLQVLIYNFSLFFTIDKFTNVPVAGFNL